MERMRLLEWNRQLRMIKILIYLKWRQISSNLESLWCCDLQCCQWLLIHLLHLWLLLHPATTVLVPNITTTWFYLFYTLTEWSLRIKNCPTLQLITNDIVLDIQTGGVVFFSDKLLITIVKTMVSAQSKSESLAKTTKIVYRKYNNII